MGQDLARLLAEAEAHLGSGKLGEAQSALVAAGKLAPRDGRVYRLLGEVLLRRGDAERAVKVLERALAFGGPEDGTALWAERARLFRPLQTTAGTRIVAREVAKLVLESSPDVSAGFATSNELAAFMPGSDEYPATDAPRPRPTVPLRAPPQGWAKANDDSQQHIDTLANRGGQSLGYPAPSAETYARNAPPPIRDASRAPPVPSPGGQSAGGPFRSGSTPGLPEPNEVLEALTIVGIFEQQGTQEPLPWATPDPGPRRRKSFALLSAASLLAVGVGVGAFFYVQSARAKAHLESEVLLAKVDADLRGIPKDFAPIEKSLGRAFELESRSPHAALSWLRERGVRGLVAGGQDIAFEGSIDRAKEVGIPESSIAFAYVASFLFQGDTAGGAALLPKWDGPAASDPYYQLVAGALLERAGDSRCLDRYEAALRLDPTLGVAELLRARATAVDGDAKRARNLAAAYVERHPNEPEGPAIIALAWARDPLREAPPKELDTAAKTEKDKLPVSLRAVPSAILALQAIEKHGDGDAKAALARALAAADTPGMASWLGGIALEAGDEELARKAALVAVTFSAVYPPARMLAARVALLGGRLDEAVKATEELDAQNPDVAIVRAAVAYERLDLDALGRALEALAPDLRRAPLLAPLAQAPGVLGGALGLRGDKLIDLSDDEGPWADVIAMDVALDQGDLATAKRISAPWKGAPARAVRLVRLSRLARYEGSTDDALKASEAALKSGTVTPRALAERVYALTAAERPKEVSELLRAYPQALGGLTKWMSAYAVASAGKIDEARGKTSQEDPPPDTSPLPTRIYVASALGAMKDAKRGAPLVKALVKSGAQNPDVAAAAANVGAGKVSPPVGPRR